MAASNEELFVRLIESNQRMLSEFHERIDALEIKIDAQNKEMERFKGALGAIMFGASCLWAAFMAFKDKFL